MITRVLAFAVATVGIVIAITAVAGETGSTADEAIRIVGAVLGVAFIGAMLVGRRKG